MNTRDLVIALRKEVIQSPMDDYENLFEKTEASEVTDDYWKHALSLYRGLDTNQRETFLHILRQVMVDTVSHVFAVLDGVSFLENQHQDFDLSYEGQQLNGELQETFLQIEEDGP